MSEERSEKSDGDRTVLNSCLSPSPLSSFLGGHPRNNWPATRELLVNVLCIPADFEHYVLSVAYRSELTDEALVAFAEDVAERHENGRVQIPSAYFARCIKDPTA